jgi:hypothetical protein
MKDILDGLVFNFENNVGKKDPSTKKMPELIGPHHWLISMINAKTESNQYKPFDTTIIAESVRIFPDSIISDKIDATHCGLIQYIYHAWAKELGIVLKPDVFFYTIISEIKNWIINNPAKCKHLFTTSDEKRRIVIVGLTIDKLIEALQNFIPCKELFDLITKTSFSTEPQHYKQILGITMADMGTPYYSYGTTKCGIPKILVQGTEADWDKLLNTVIDLRKNFGGCSNILANYLSTVHSTLDKLIESVFKANDGSYLENIFTYYRNPICGSGHLPLVLDGWIKKLYIGNYSRLVGIGQYPSHFNCLPYDDRDDPENIKYYFYTCGLSSSKIVNGYLYPEYNIAHCELTDPNKKIIFDILTNN